MAGVPEFLFSLFSHLPPGYIEIRIIEDRKGGQVIERRWYESAAALAQAIDGLNEIAEANSAAIFFGVLPRKAIGLGTTRDVFQGHACWSDLDFRDFQGGEIEARRVLDAFPMQPSIIVRSGHGLHVYWLFREPVETSIIQDLSRRIAGVLGGDHAFDAARVLRLPGTWNRKDPDNPILVQIESAVLTRAYNLSDFEDYIPPDEDECGPESDDISLEPISTDDALSPRVVEILSRSPRIRDLFHGCGKIPRTDDGHGTDTTSSGYDYSLVLALARKGVTDESELATALWCRPDGQARRKGEQYIARTVGRALAQLSSQSQKSANRREKNMADFTVERVRVFNSDPPQCELTVEGHSILLASKELLSPSVVRQRLFNVLRRVPTLPKPAEWHEKVNELMAQAEVVEQPPEASQEEFLRDQIRGVIAELHVGEAIADLDRGMALQHNGALVFKTAAVHKSLRESYREVTSGEICTHLHAMGYVWSTPKIDAKTVRVWTRLRAPDDDTDEAIA